METILSKYRQLRKDESFYNCKLCNYKAPKGNLNNILAHLRLNHNVTRGSRKNPVPALSNYIKEFFVSPTCACGCNKNVSLHGRRLYFNLFADDCTNKKRFLSPACPEFYLFRGDDVENVVSNIQYIQKKIITEQHLDKLIRHNTGQNNPASLASISLRIKKPIAWIKRRLSEKTSGKHNGFYGKKHTLETKRLLAIQRAKQAKMVTRPELVIFGILSTFGVKFRYQGIADIYVVDFLLDDKVIIEAYSDYWHSAQFKGGQKKRCDEKRNEYLINIGYKIHVFWESEIMTKTQEVVRRINEIIIKKTN